MNLNSITHVITNLSNTMNGVIMRLNDIDVRIRELKNQSPGTSDTATLPGPGPDMKKYVDDQIAYVKQQVQRIEENVQQTNKQIGTLVSNVSLTAVAAQPQPTLMSSEPVGADMGSSSLLGSAVLEELNIVAASASASASTSAVTNTITTVDDEFTMETKKKGGRKGGKR